MFPPNFHYSPTETHKSLKFYQAILSETASIAIKPIPDRKNEKIILYHSLTINRFLTESEWGIPLYKTKSLHSNHFPIHLSNYNYFDYIQAWTNIFLHQKEDFSHSWFITFDKSFKLVFPAWFHRWWTTHGPMATIVPDEFMQVLKESFQKKFDRSRFDDNVSLLALFMAKYRVPWILRWIYQVETHEVNRQRMVKWWDKFDHKKIIEVVLRDFPITPVPVPAVAAHPPKALPASEDHSQHLSDISPSSSLQGKSKSKSSSSKKQSRLDLAQQLLAEAAMLQKDSDSESSDASSENPAISSAYQDAQDPFDL